MLYAYNTNRSVGGQYIVALCIVHVTRLRFCVLTATTVLQVSQLLRKTALLEERIAEAALCVLAQVLHNAARAPAPPDSSYRQLLQKTLSSLVLVVAKHCPGVVKTVLADGEGEEEEEEEEEVRAYTCFLYIFFVLPSVMLCALTR